MEIREGYMPFKEYKTYYRIVGKKTGNKKPLVLLHGGPGSTHNYFEVLDRLAEEDGRELVMYDQIGCGESYVDNRPDLWKAETWIEELKAIREHLGLDEIHLLGQSWGGMLLLDYVCNYKPEGLKSLILSSTLPASWMWGIEQHRMIKELPQEMQDAISDLFARYRFTESQKLEIVKNEADLRQWKEKSYTAAADYAELDRRRDGRKGEAYVLGMRKYMERLRKEETEAREHHHRML